jgi:NAD(P) transhydrogenase subunit alpha
VSVGGRAAQADGERRGALTPAMIERLSRRGTPVVVAPEAGGGAGITDDEFVVAGASIGNPATADVLVCVNPPAQTELERLREGTVLIGFLAPLTAPQRLEQLDRAGIVAFAMESMPRNWRAPA